ncbi:TdcA1-ORF1-ORF2 protein [Corchorus olitorius]|uniref:TdcA1-ORF1-ORF2 protein n=1 Tax=Corchorus olitorius TaxID=93759 RepID=A0A1R3KSM7_9ROSI|nr:TdcA1-ORF1-ORF2 protein [Corchorus olitorius]
MDVPGKSNNARKDIKVVCDREDIAVDADVVGRKPKAIYTLRKEHKELWKVRFAKQTLHTKSTLLLSIILNQMSVVQVGDLEGMMKWMFVNYLKREGHTPESIDLAIDMHFAEWFRLFVLTEENGVTNQLLRTLAWGPTEKATSWPAYLVNGYKFHTAAHGRGKATMNSGICVRGSDPNDPSSNFYGYLKDIVQVQGIDLEVYLGVLPQSVPSEFLSDEEEFESTESSDEDGDDDNNIDDY